MALVESQTNVWILFVGMIIVASAVTNPVLDLEENIGHQNLLVTVGGIGHLLP